MSWRKFWPDATILATAAFLRFWELSLKPPHFDEGINGWFVDQMFVRGFFPYDPSNYHGPLHFYLIQISQLALGFHIFALRFVPVVFSLGTVVLILRHRKYLGRTALWAGAAFAISPALVFYSRYSIHESELVFFLTLISYGYLKWIFEKANRSWLWIGLGISGSLVTKETWVIHLAVMGIAILLLPLLNRIWPEKHLVDEQTPTRQPSSMRENHWIALGVGIWVVVIVFFSGFFQNAVGILDFFKAFLPWFHTGSGGAGHEKPLTYWVELMAKYETLLLVGFIACTALLPRTSRAIRFLGLSAAGTLVAYSLVPYKTPWCSISFLWLFCFTFGYAFESSLRAPALVRALSIAGLLGLGTFGLYRTIDLNFYSYDKESEPYVYVSTFRDLKEWKDEIEGAAQKQPGLKNARIAVCLNSYWPLPWMLREWTGVAFSGRACKGPYSEDLVLVDESELSRFELELGREYFKKRYRFRGSQEAFFAFFKTTTWKNSVEGAP